MLQHDSFQKRSISLGEHNTSNRLPHGFYRSPASSLVRPELSRRIEGDQIRLQIRTTWSYHTNDEAVFKKQTTTGEQLVLSPPNSQPSRPKTLDVPWPLWLQI